MKPCSPHALWPSCWGMRGAQPGDHLSLSMRGQQQQRAAGAALSAAFRAVLDGAAAVVARQAPVGVAAPAPVPPTAVSNVVAATTALVAASARPVLGHTAAQTLGSAVHALAAMPVPPVVPTVAPGPAFLPGVAAQLASATASAGLGTMAPCRSFVSVHSANLAARCPLSRTPPHHRARARALRVPISPYELAERFACACTRVLRV